MNNKISKFIKKRGSIILTIATTIGIVSSVGLAIKATPRAIKLIENEKITNKDISKMDIIKTVYPVYIPTAVCMVVTISCVFSNHILNRKRQKNLIGAYILLNEQYKLYKSKVRIKDVMAEPINIPEGEDRLYYDTFSCRYFRTTPEKLEEDMYIFNLYYKVLHEASLNELYDIIGLEQIPSYDELGWSIHASDIYNYNNVSYSEEDCILDDGMECTIFTILTEPTVDYLDC